jgi:hypothetical protein
MPAKTQFSTEQYLRSIALPTHGKRYQVISHGHIIDQTRNELTTAGFDIKTELYKTTLDGQIAQGIYHLNHASDPEMGLMFAWSNSYNKMMRFKCAVGAHVFVCMNGVVSGDLANFKRKHTGTALTDVNNNITTQISGAKEYYNNLIADKEMFKQVVLSKKDQASIVGRLYLDEEIITLTQVGMVKRELETPSYNYNVDPNSAWSLYNHVTLSLKDSHPMRYLSDHQKLHSFFVNEFGSLTANAVYAPVEEAPEFEEAVTSDDDNVFGVNFL